MNCFLVTYTIKIEIYAVDLEIDQDKHAHLFLLIQVKSAVPKVWVAKGLKMDSATMIQICQNELFSFHFSSSFNSVKDWIIASYAFHLASPY